MRARLRGGVAAIAALLLAETTWGSAPLTYQVEVAPNPCVQRAEFEHLVALRGTTAVPTMSADSDLAFDVRIERMDGGSVGTLVVHEGSRSYSRTLPAGNCAEAADALALVAALILDSRGMDRARQPPSLGGEPAPAATPPPPPPPTPPKASVQWRLFGSGAALLTGGVSPTAQPGMIATVGASQEASGSVLAWQFGGYYAFTTQDTLTDVFPSSGAIDPKFTGRFGWWTVGASACPVAWPPGPARLRGCALFEGGLISFAQEVSPEALDPNTSPSETPWLAAGAGFEWQWTLLPFLELQLSAEVLFPILRESFYFSGAPVGSPPVYENPAFTMRASAGFTLLLPL